MKKTTCIDRVSINSFHYTGQYTSTGWDTPYIGEISWFAGNFAPHGWALCDGQILSINEYPALFSILGTIYGGDGRTTFALPDMRGRSPLHAGRCCLFSHASTLALLAWKPVAQVIIGHVS